MSTWYFAVPEHDVATAPPSIPHFTSTALREAAAVSRTILRLNRPPRLSSPTSSTPTRASRRRRMNRSACRAETAATSPPLLSAAPDPYRRFPDSRNGAKSRFVYGVSRCPRTSTSLAAEPSWFDRYTVFPTSNSRYTCAANPACSSRRETAAPTRLTSSTLPALELMSTRCSSSFSLVG